MYRNKLSDLYLPQENDVIVDLWVGSSEVSGVGATQATMISPTAAAAPTPLTISRIWDRFLDGTYRLAGNTNPDSFGWDLTPLASSSSGTNTTVAYGQGLWYQQRTPVKGVMDQTTVPYHHTVLLGISGSALNDDTTAVATKLAHWNPLVTGTGETTDLSTDMGACEHYITNYMTPALKNLQAAGKRVFIGGLYVSISGDSLSTYAAADAKSWAANFAMLRRAIEIAIGFVGLPTVVMGVTLADYAGSGGVTTADEQDAVRTSQQAYVAANSSTTIYFDTTPYPTSDQFHFDGQATIDISGDVTAARYATRMGLAQITKVF